MTYEQKVIEWMTVAFKSIAEAGGLPEKLIGRFPTDLLETLVRNDLRLVYTKGAKA